MVGVAEHELSSGLDGLPLVDGLEGGVGAHRHKGGRLDHAVRRRDAADARARARLARDVQHLELEKVGRRVRRERLRGGRKRHHVGHGGGGLGAPRAADARLLHALAYAVCARRRAVATMRGAIATFTFTTATITFTIPAAAVTTALPLLRAPLRLGGALSLGHARALPVLFACRGEVLRLEVEQLRKQNACTSALLSTAVVAAICNRFP
mmetsp:Transcript_6449/g.14057  ORF Transcript_6449/g.14057 Transcript_6449/m.14057 type:complete len:210 (+) Transcript_6449:1266-1895(+)